MVSRHCESATFVSWDYNCERTVLTIWIVSDEEMAKVLSHPGYSHLKGSTISSRHYRSSHLLTLLGVAPFMSRQRRRFRECLIADVTYVWLVTYVRLQVAQDLLTRLELSPAHMTAGIPQASVGVFALANVLLRQVNHQGTSVEEWMTSGTTWPHANQRLGRRGWRGSMM